MKVYNCGEGTLAFSLEGHSARIQRCMFFHHNQQLVLTASQDGSLKVFRYKEINSIVILLYSEVPLSEGPRYCGLSFIKNSILIQS